MSTLGIIDGAIMDQELLRHLAKKYIWWKSPDEAVAYPHRIMAQVMNTGDIDDVNKLTDAVGDQVLISVLRNAEAGEFNLRSWRYWHYRLGLSECDTVPPLPERKLS